MKNIAKGITRDGETVEGFLFWMEIDGEAKPCISRSPLKVNDWGEVKFDGDVVLEDTIRFSTGRCDVNGRTIYFDDMVSISCYDGRCSEGHVRNDLSGCICVFDKYGFTPLSDGVVTVLESPERLGYTAKKTKWRVKVND